METIYEVTYAKMPNSFTSNQFAKQLRKIKAPKHLIDEQANFLHENCIQRDTKRTWIKKNSQAKLPFQSFSQRKGCDLAPHIIKDAMKGTVTVVPQGKEKEFIESTKVAPPRQRIELKIGWGLLTIKF